MNLKKIVSLLLVALCLATVTPAFATDETPITNTENPKNDARSQQLTNRLIQIRDMDKSNLTRAEKKELRKEVKQIKKEARGRGIYLSVGAIIIIILLLILLL
jgi:hypothetical protein